MSIIRHVLSFTWLIVITGFLISIIYLRSDLFSEHINKSIDDFSSAIGFEIPRYVPVSHPVQPTEVIENETVEADAPTSTPEKIVIVEADSPISTPEITVKEDTELAPGEMKPEEEPQIVEPQILDNTASEDSPLLAIEEVSEKPEIAEQIPPYSTVEEVTHKEPQSKDTDILFDTRQELRHARELYWKNQFEEAESAYLKLAEHAPQNPDVFGELGNVYYSQGKWKQAAYTYNKAVLLLVDLKRLKRADHLLRFIQSIDAEAAAELRQKIRNDK